MNPTELQPSELMQIAADFFESEGIHYRVVGSMASMVYGEPRFTNDVDMVAELTMEKVPALCKAFAAPDFYVSEQAAQDAVKRRFQFNIIHPASGLKVDVIVPAITEFTQSEKTRIKRITSEGEYSVWFGSPEDVLLNKLIYFKLGGGESQKHLCDIGGMLKLLGVKPWEARRVLAHAGKRQELFDGVLFAKGSSQSTWQLDVRRHYGPERSRQANLQELRKHWDRDGRLPGRKWCTSKTIAFRGSSFHLYLDAAFIGITGTPLMAGEEKTKEVFGDYVSIYNFQKSIEDNARPDFQTYMGLGEAHAIFSYLNYAEVVSLPEGNLAVSIFDFCMGPGTWQYDRYVDGCLSSRAQGAAKIAQKENDLSLIHARRVGYKYELCELIQTGFSIAFPHNRRSRPAFTPNGAATS